MKLHITQPSPASCHFSSAPSSQTPSFYVLPVPINVRGCIQKFQDWVDNEINNNKHPLRSNPKGYGGRTH